ncbi:mitotic spindle assembly checkpoint protein MAD2B-like isoform X1 [Halichondria panicea]|uniref:mitotic spindle assembly checkpoint protein MAD2B-like isoform X1 n=1 Tax=Halichondria panicea TaxID=6063 RepID=UPI00312B95A6
MSSVAARQIVQDNLSGLDVREVSSNILCEFLEVAFHLILYIREIYPPVLFERRRKYNVPVYMCVHPELCQYLRDVLTGLLPLMKEGKMEEMWLSVQNKEHKVVEKFVFELRGLDNEALSNDAHLLQLERDLRAILLKISVCDALLSPIPPGKSHPHPSHPHTHTHIHTDCTFSVQVQTTLRSAEAMEHQQAVKEFPWVTADPIDLTEATVVPLKTVSSSLLQMQLCVIESPLKSKEQ